LSEPKKRLAFTPSHLAAASKAARCYLDIAELVLTEKSVSLTEDQRRMVQEDRDKLYQLLGLIEEALAGPSQVVFQPDEGGKSFGPNELGSLIQVRNKILETMDQEIRLTMDKQRVKRTGLI
jgi:hypothetical protein